MNKQLGGKMNTNNEEKLKLYGGFGELLLTERFGLYLGSIHIDILRPKLPQ